MIEYRSSMYSPNELYHFGVKGMRWGIRRYQNKDGSLTSAGQRHRDQLEGGGGRMTLSGRFHARAARNGQRDADSLRKAGYREEADAVQKVADKHRSKITYKTKSKSSRLKKALGLTLGAATAAGLAYGGYKLKKMGPTGRALLKERGNLALKSLQSKAADKKVDILERGGLKGIAKTKATNAGLRARTAYDNARGALARGKRTVYENGGLANTVRRKYTTAGGARGIASGLTGRAKSAARYYGEKASSSNAGTRARNLYNQSRNFAKSGVGKAKTAYGNASDAVGRKLVKLYSSDAYGKVANAKYNVGQAASKVGRKVSGAASEAYSNAWKYGRKAATAASEAYDRRKRKRAANKATLSRF